MRVHNGRMEEWKNGRMEECSENELENDTHWT